MKPCGTRAAYVRHRRRGEQPCEDCTEANRIQSARDRRARGIREQDRRPCGSYAGWFRHWRRNEEPCWRCVEAARSYWRNQKNPRDRGPLTELVEDIIEAWGHPMSAEEIVGHVQRIRPEANRVGVVKALNRSRAVSFERAGEWLWRLNA